MATPIISYKDAKAKGLKRYFTGKKCKRGHLGERFVSNCRCMECAYAQTARWLDENQELNKKLQADWRLNNRQYAKQWAKENPGAQRIAAAKWYRANADREIQKSLDWARNNPEKSRARCRNRTALRKKAAGSHTAEQIIEMLERQKWKCVACDISLRKKRHIDHIVPLKLGGSNDISNLQGLCPTCNCSKNAKDPVVWAREIGKLI